MSLPFIRMNAFDPELLERCRAGDHRAWSTLVDRFAPLVYAIARRHSLHSAACDDVAQSVFVALVRRLPSIRAADALPAWLATAARRESRRHLAHARKLRDRDLSAGSERPTLADPPDATLEAIEQQSALRIAIADLGGRCRRLLELLYFQPSAPDYSDIARQLAMPVGSIGPTRRRCITKLLRLMEPNQPGPDEPPAATDR